MRRVTRELSLDFHMLKKRPEGHDAGDKFSARLEMNVQRFRTVSKTIR